MASREVRPAQISSIRMGCYADWTLANLRRAPGAQADPDLCRQSYLMWCSDLFQKPEPRSKQRAAVEAAGGVMKGTGADLVYLDVELMPLPRQAGSAAEVAAGVVALRDAGLISASDAIAAAMRLA